MPERQSSNSPIATVCDICGLPKKNQHSGTITGWIFGAARCKCSSTDRSGGGVSALSGANLEIQSARTNLNETYDLLEIIGTGGMGKVHKVRDKTGTSRLMALKLLRPELANDPIAVRRFQQEVLAAKELQHPNLVRIFDCGVSHEGNPYFVMELIEGESLASVLQREGTISAERAVALFTQVCSALSHAHEHNIIHRDLKPSNILLTRCSDSSEVIKLVDFGVAKILPTPGKDTFTITRTGEIFGSPIYMSPEQCQGEKVDSRSDIYSLGCVLYESLTGHPPIYSDNPVKTLLGHIYDRPAPMQMPNVDRRIARKLDAIVGTCLEKQPGCRYDSVKALSDDLQTVASDKEPKAFTDARAREKSENLKRNIRMNTAMALPTVLVAFIILFVWYTGSDLVQISRFIDSVEKEPKNYFNPDLAKQSGIDPYDIPYCYEFVGESSAGSHQLPKAVDIFSAESKLFVSREDKDSAVAPTVWLERYEASLAHKSSARTAAFDAANLLLASTRQIPKGMRFGRWFYIMIYPAKLEMYKIPQILDEQRDYKTAEQLCKQFSQSILDPANKYPSLATECCITDTIHNYYLGNAAFGNMSYKMTMDRVGSIPNDPMGPLNRFIANNVGLATDIVEMYFGDRRCPPELLNRYFGNCAIVAGDYRTARIIFSNIDKAYRAIGLASCETLAGARNTSMLWDRAIADRLTTVDWPEDDLIDRLYLNQKYAELDVIYPALISAAKRRGQPAATVLLNMESKYFSILTAQKKQDQAAAVLADVTSIANQTGYSLPLHTALRSIGDNLVQSRDFINALSTYQQLLSRDSSCAAGQQFVGWDKLDIACVQAAQGNFAKADTIYGDLLQNNRDKAIRNCVWMAKANEDKAHNLAQSVQDISNIPIVNPSASSLVVGSFNLTPWVDCNLYMWDQCARILTNGHKLANPQQFLSDSLEVCQNANLALQAYHCQTAAGICRRLPNTSDSHLYANQAEALHNQMTRRVLYEMAESNREWSIYVGALDQIGASVPKPPGNPPDNK